MLTFYNLGNSGRFGNQLFQIASTIGVAIKNNHNYIFPTWEYSSYFHDSIPQTPSKYINPTININVDQCHYKDIDFKSIEPLRNKQLITLSGYLQTEKYFNKYRDLILDYFTPNILIDKYILKKYNEILKLPLCSIHVRRTDYLDLQQWHPQCTIEYYEKAIKEMNHNKIQFLVFSDDINWCKNIFKGQRFTFIENEDNIVDMFLMSLCDHNIIANSSFSWWGAWLNRHKNKKVIAPKTWFGPKYDHWDKSDLLPESWVKI
jgi:hypothetical protein